MYIFVKEIIKDVIKHKLEYFNTKWFGEENITTGNDLYSLEMANKC